MTAYYDFYLLMSQIDDEIGLTSDSSLENPENDELGYREFSQYLADTITTRVPTDEFVVGVYGKWGSGKSTILNFLELYLKDQDDPPVVVRFNPWWFSGETDLIDKFFTQLEAGLEDGHGFSEVRNQLSKFALGLSNIPLGNVAGVPSDTVLKLIGHALEVESENLDELKEKIASNLEDADQRIVILIDDIDRLTKDEINQMFRLVKSVADFPNVVYVLAFDPEVVTNALQEEQAIENGEEYLEKIIQLPLHIPVPAKDALDQFFTGRLDEIIEGTDPVLDEDAWSHVYRKGIRPTIETPRDAVRLTNAVDTMYTKLENEVNFVDLVALETLRVFYRPTYDKIRNNRDRFVSKGRRHSNQDGDEFDDLWEDYSDSDGDDPDVKNVQNIVSYLFPRVPSSQGLSAIFSSYTENKDTYRKRKRICDPAMFPYYFRQQVPRGELTTEEIQSIISTTDEAKKFAERLHELSKLQEGQRRSHAHNFLDRFVELASEVPEENIEDVITAFFLVGEDLIQADPPRSSFNQGNRKLINSIVFKLLRRLDSEDKRVTILESAFTEGNSAYLPPYILGLMLQEHGELGGNEKREEQRLLEYHRIEDLKESAVNKVEQTAEEDELLDSYNLSLVLDRWNEWSDSQELITWAQQVTDDDRNLIRFVNGHISQGRASGTPIDYIDPRWLEPFLDVSEVQERIGEMNKDTLNESDQQVIETFEKGVEYLENGQDPSDLETWIFPKDRLSSRD